MTPALWSPFTQGLQTMLLSWHQLDIRAPGRHFLSPSGWWSPYRNLWSSSLTQPVRSLCVTASCGHEFFLDGPQIPQTPLHLSVWLTTLFPLRGWFCIFQPMYPQGSPSPPSLCGSPPPPRNLFTTHWDLLVGSEGIYNTHAQLTTPLPCSLHDIPCLQCLVTQLHLTLCDPMDCSLPGSSVYGILQARILEWVAIFLLQGILPIQGSNPHVMCLLHCRQILHPLSQRGSPCSIPRWIKLQW